MSKYHKNLTQEQIKLLEQLAEIEHQRWADWQRYVHQVFRNGKFKEFMPRWERQINTPYKDLPEGEKESDREQVMRYWDLIINQIEISFNIKK